MKNREKQNEKPAADRGAGSHQTDLAEGELETVEECIRIHERKGDLQTRAASRKGGGRQLAEFPRQ